MQSKALHKRALCALRKQSFAFEKSNRRSLFFPFTSMQRKTFMLAEVGVLPKAKLRFAL
jgi:hypothetical protein